MVTSRPTQYVGVNKIGACVFRTYEIAVTGTSVDPRLQAAARPVIEQFASQVGGNAGFLIYHRARPANFVLAHVWDGVDLIQRYWTSPLDAPAQLAPHRAGAIGCVWELDVIGRERDAWAPVCERGTAVEDYLGTPTATS